MFISNKRAGGQVLPEPEIGSRRRRVDRAWLVADVFIQNSVLPDVVAKSEESTGWWGISAALAVPAMETCWTEAHAEVLIGSQEVRGHPCRHGAEGLFVLHRYPRKTEFMASRPDLSRYWSQVLAADLEDVFAFHIRKNRRNGHSSWCFLICDDASSAGVPSYNLNGNFTAKDFNCPSSPPTPPRLKAWLACLRLCIVQVRLGVGMSNSWRQV